ncbi:MAG: hypothetical protein P1U41_09490 [Vicingaceae bacterium]|nr:hypothetical protein [Vicingaceae bacterium]
MMNNVNDKIKKESLQNSPVKIFNAKTQKEKQSLLIPITNSAIIVFLLLWVLLTQHYQIIFKEVLSASFIIVSILLLKTASKH